MTPDVEPLTPSVPGVDKPIQFVSADGRPTVAGSTYGIDHQLGQDLFRHMFRARRLDQEALALQRQGELGLWLQCWGQEAAQVGSVVALDEQDHVFPSYREHAAALARGLRPDQLLSQWRGTTHAGWEGYERNVHFYSLVLGTQTLHATGYAMGAVLEGSDQVVAVYFGDGAASQGDVAEAFNWAATHRLPVLFFCQNNQWAISTPTSSQYRTPVRDRAAGFGLQSFHVDGNDALAVHAVTKQAVAYARSGEGPVLVEAETFRMAGHSTSDDPTRYRTPEELARWEARDPLRRMRVLLEESGVDAAWFDSVAADAEDLGLEVRRACRALAAPNLDELFSHAYAEPHALVDAERLSRRQLLDQLEPVA